MRKGLSCLLACFSIAAASTLHSCKSPGGSEVKHDLGETSRVTKDTKFATCVSSIETLENFPKTQAYLKSIAKAIAEGNKNIFQGNLDIENFCFNVVNDYTFNAGAISLNRSISFNMATLYMTENDAQVAATMAHELAHVTRLHSRMVHSNFKPSKQNAKLLKEFEKNQQNLFKALDDMGKATQKLQALSANIPQETQFVAALNQIRKNLTTPDEEQPNLGKIMATLSGDGKKTEFIKQIDKTIAQLEEASKRFKKEMDIRDRLSKRLQEQMIKTGTLGSKESYSWQEQEADEVGLEFFLRAGFKHSEYIAFQSIMFRVDTTDPADVDRCLAAAYPLVSGQGGEEPERGTEGHPLPCWRLYDTIRESHQTHLKDYESFIRNNDRLTVSPEARLAALEEVNAYLNSPVNGGQSSETGSLNTDTETSTDTGTATSTDTGTATTK